MKEMGALNEELDAALIAQEDADMLSLITPKTINYFLEKIDNTPCQNEKRTMDMKQEFSELASLFKSFDAQFSENKVLDAKIKELRLQVLGKSDVNESSMKLDKIGEVELHELERIWEEEDYKNGFNKTSLDMNMFYGYSSITSD